MAGTLVPIPLAPFGSVVCDNDASWQSPIYQSQGYRGGQITLSVLGIYSVGGAPNLTVILQTSNDGLNWTSSAALFGPIGAPGTYQLSPTDLAAFYRFDFNLNGGGVPGNIAAVTYGLFVNLKDT